MLHLPDGSMITGHAGHQIFVVRRGTAHWIPDSWTMYVEGLSPRNLLILEDIELERIRIGHEIPTAIPNPRLADGTVIETESGIWQVRNGLLDVVINPRTLRQAAFDNDRDVVWLPDSIVRGIRRSQRHPGAVGTY